MLEYLVIVCAVAVFGLQHSGLSAIRVKSRVIKKWGKNRYGRVFTVTSVVSLMLAFLSMGYWDWLYFIFSPEDANVFLALAGVVSILIGLIIAKAASKDLSVTSVADMRTDRKPELVTRGVYSRLRHPLYLATILILVGTMLLYPFPSVLVFCLSLIAYVLIGARLEERKLVVIYGQEYLDYRHKAGFMLPRVSRSHEQKTAV
jgi:protein-S-isoprenylcysteine O-methyltransferase Ste14